MESGLTDEQGRRLLQLARQAISGRLGIVTENDHLADPAFDAEHGTFVTLRKSGSLRGCIGNLLANETVAAGVRRNAISAAFHDSRFSPLTATEFEDVEIDISILSQPQTLEYTDAADLIGKLRPGIDGLVLKLGGAGATFLPQVWEQLPDPELFLGHLCRKAGLAESAWKDSHPEIETYQVQCFNEEQG